MSLNSAQCYSRSNLIFLPICFRVANVLLSNLYTVTRSREPAGKSLQDEVQAEQTGPEQALAHVWLLFM